MFEPRGCAKTGVKNYALLHASILAILCAVCDISDGRSGGHAFMTQNIFLHNLHFFPKVAVYVMAYNGDYEEKGINRLDFDGTTALF